MIDAVRDIGKKAAEHELLAAIGMSSSALEAIGIQYPKKAAFRATNALNEIGLETANHEFESGYEHYRIGIVESIKAIYLRSIDDGLYAGNAIRGLEAIGLKTAEKRFKRATDSVVNALESIQKKAEATNDEKTMTDIAISLGNVLSEFGSYEQAIQEYNKAIDIDTERFEAWSGKGDAFMKMGKFEDALKAYEKSIELNPTARTSYYRKERALRALGRCPEAETALAKAKELESQAERFGKYLDIMSYANAANHRRDDEEAIRLYDKAIEIYPRKPNAWQLKAEVLRKVGRNTEADAAFLEAEKLGHKG